MRDPKDKSPEPPGGRAAERLREFLRQRVPEDQTAEKDKDQATQEDKEAGSEPENPQDEPKGDQQPE